MCRAEGPLFSPQLGILVRPRLALSFSSMAPRLLSRSPHFVFLALKSPMIISQCVFCSSLTFRHFICLKNFRSCANVLPAQYPRIRATGLFCTVLVVWIAMTWRSRVGPREILVVPTCSGFMRISSPPLGLPLLLLAFSVRNAVPSTDVERLACLRHGFCEGPYVRGILPPPLYVGCDP